MSVRRMVPDYDGRIPRWYGVAYREVSLAVMVCYPIPLNWVVRWFDLLRWRLKGPRSHSSKEHLLAEARLAGFEAGKAVALRWDRESVFNAGYQAHAVALTMMLDRKSDEEVRERVTELWHEAVAVE